MASTPPCFTTDHCPGSPSSIQGPPISVDDGLVYPYSLTFPNHASNPLFIASPSAAAHSLELSITPPPASLNDIFTKVDESIESLKKPWCRPVMFAGIEGHSGQVDLFSLTGPENRHFRNLIFDRAKYPPTPDSLKRLLSDIQAAANKQGIRLVNGGKLGVLVCQRSRRFRDEKKKHLPKLFSSNSFLQEKIRAYSYNRDRTNQRKLGKSAPRGTHTCLPVDVDDQCKARITITQFDAHDDQTGYLYIRGGFGCHIHTNHYQVAPDHVRVSLSNLNAPTVKSITQASRALLGAGNTRSLALEAGQTYVSSSQMQYLRRQAVESAKVSFGTTAEDLMDYLKNNDDISFVALYHNSQVPASSNYHSHPSGRPPNEGRRSIQDINNDLTMTVSGRLESISQPDQGNAVLSEYQNYSADVDHQARLDKSTYEYIQNSRTSQGVSPTTQLLLCSAWGIRSQIRRFWRYPETLYIDTTFKTNNEQRPFLMICGKDANGEIYIFLRIYL
jgi:hypothetical protein